MIYISFIDKDSDFVIKTIRACKKYLKGKEVSYSVYYSYQEFWEHFKDGSRLHILFSDLSLEEEDEILEAKKIKQKCPWVQLIFYSSKIEYSLLTYDVFHVYFFLKNQMEVSTEPALHRSLLHLERLFHNL